MESTLKARNIVKAVVLRDLAPALKTAGFRKTQFTFARRKGEAAHLIQIQLSSWNQGMDGAFYVNVGIMFDEMRKHFDRPFPPLPAYDDCDLMVRLEALVPEAPAQWTVDSLTSVSELSLRLARCIVDEVVRPLDGVSSLAEFEKLGWEKAVPWGFPAWLQYLRGNHAAASEHVKAQADYFRDRGVTYESLLEAYRFTNLQR